MAAPALGLHRSVPRTLGRLFWVDVHTGSFPAMTSTEVSITLPAEPASIKRARDFVARAVADRVDDPAEVLLMTTELVANVVGHVGCLVTITVCSGPVVRVEVHNHQAATQAFRDLLDHSPRSASGSPSGRGLGIVRSLASRVGLDDDPGRGKVVWFEWEDPAHRDDGDAELEADGEPIAVRREGAGPNRPRPGGAGSSKGACPY